MATRRWLKKGLFVAALLIGMAAVLHFLVSRGNLKASPLASPEDKPQWQHYKTRAKVMGIAFEGQHLWLGLLGGMIRHDMRTFKSHDLYTAQNTGGGLMSNGVYRLKIDRQGNKWICTYGGGLIKFDRTQWTSYTPFGFGSPVSYGKAWRSYKPGEGLGDLWVYDVAFDRNGTLWVATWKGVSRFDGDKFTTFTMDDGLVDKWVYTIGIDQEGVLWFGTEGGVTRFDGKEWRSYTHRDGLGAKIQEDLPGDPYAFSSPHHATTLKQNVTSNPNYVVSIAVDPRNAKWFGTWGAGVTWFDGKNWKTYTTKEGLAGNFIFALAVDRKGILWAGTNKGASRFDGKQWRNYTKRDGLLDDFVYSIGVDNENNKWFGTRIGVSKLNERD